MTMRIGMVLCDSKAFLFDIRVEKEARALIQAGFQVALLCCRMSEDEPEREVLDYGLTVFRSNPLPDRLSWRIRQRLHMLMGMYTGVLPSWEPAIRSFVSEFRPDVLHAHDLPSVPTTVKIAKELSLPAVADLHENMPAAYVAYAKGWRLRARLWFRWVQTYRRWRQLEKRALRQCRRIIIVVPEAGKRILEDYGIPPQKLLVVSNTEDETTFDLGDPDPNIVGRYANCWGALYIGGMGRHRGISTAIRAAAIAGSGIPEFKLIVVGIKESGRGELDALARAVGAEKYVELIGWVPFHQVNGYIAACRVGLVPHEAFEHTQTTVPHKLFQYMIMGKPVVVSDCAPLKRIVEETQTGMVFHAGSSEDLALCLARLYKEKDIAAGYGRNGRRATVGGPYSWAHDADRLIEMYRSLENDLA